MDKSDVAGLSGEEGAIQIQVCQCIRIGQGWEDLRMLTSCWVLYHNDAPGARMIHAGLPVEMMPDRIYLLAPGTEFHTRITAHPHQLYIHFNFTLPRQTFLPGIASCACEGAAAELVGELRRDIQPRTVRTPMPIVLRATALCSLALMAWPPERSREGLWDPRIADALANMRSIFRMPQPLSYWAGQAGLGVAPFIRLFRKHTGMTPHRFIAELRIAQARRLLLETEMRIDDIGRAVGYPDRFHFSRVFRRHTGIPPSAYRRRG
jgi:AraC-like DNA-binding protein